MDSCGVTEIASSALLFALALFMLVFTYQVWEDGQ